MRHVHFIGIGGIGVSGIAQLALRRGDIVSGSDLKESLITNKLVKLGAKVYIGHKPQNIDGCSLVIYSSAISESNPEIKEARRRGIAVRRRAEFLSELMALKKVVTITGAHGKTTTSSLAAKLLLESGFSPSVAVGGILREDGDNAKFSEGDYFVAEADESDGTFLCYSPTYSIITNIDYEHMDFYKTYDNLVDSFNKFARQTKNGGCIFYYFEDEPLKKAVYDSAVRSVSFGYSADADLYAKDISLSQCHLSFSCFDADGRLGEISVSLSGRHNVLNVLAVIALGRELGLDFNTIKKSLEGFRGVERRFQVKLDNESILIVDDYAHHPTEICATIEAARVCNRKRIIVVFQPHRYSRTKSLMDKFERCFSKSDHLIITDIYAAGERAIEGISARDLTERVKSCIHKNVEYVPKDGILKYLDSIVVKGDMVLFLGAGDITKVSDEFSGNFKERS